MATVPFSTLPLSKANPLFASPLAHSQQKPHAPPSHLAFTTRATPENSEPDTNTTTTDSTQAREPDSFDVRLSQVRLRYRSGTGKKSEIRKTRKSKKGTSSGAGIYLPPVPLKEPVSGGLKVDFGFSPYSERVNGRVAILGLSALILVELATGKSVISYHSPAVVLIQVYFVAAVTALYVKWEKERISVWPQ
ncbi:unnamed protein product [Ilex paraguariensis]|uniref:Uncharacterized protein n=1 Tax=Ilex paraguariensis TaxID=185542 RepID=A0ABC8SD04_9AQUA